MNKLVVITALALLAASPAFAKSRHHVVASPAATASFNNAYGSISDPAAVMQGSRMVGRDPDAGIRTRILLQSQTSYFSK